MTSRRRKLLRASCEAIVGALGVAGAACAGADGGAAPAAPSDAASLRVVAGAGVADTILVQPTQPLVVEVRAAGGKPAAGAVVRFDARPPDEATRPLQYAAFVCPPSARACPVFDPISRGPFGDPAVVVFAEDTADAAGRARAVVRLGNTAGLATVVVSVPALGLRDSATFVVRPGAATRVTLAPRDTTVYRGRAARLAATVTDQFGNRRADPVTFAASAVVGDAAVVGSDGTVAGARFGRTAAVARSGGVADTAYVSVVPEGRLVGWAPFDGNGSVVIVGMDGSGLRRIGPANRSMHAMPTWTPRGDAVVYTAPDGGPHDEPAVHVVDTLGLAARRLASGVVWAHHATVVGERVFFVGQRAVQDWWVYRTRLDGAEVEPVMRFGGSLYSFYFSPGALAVSADGRRAVASGTSGDMRLLDLETGAERALPGEGYSPRWNPAGTLFVFGAGFGRVMTLADAGGTVLRTLSPAEPGFGWSPDGEWVIGRTGVGPRMLAVRVADGLALPFRLPVDLFDPSWR